MKFDFDTIGEWAPRLATVLDTLVPDRLRERAAAGPIEWLEDALDIILEEVERSGLIDATCEWLRGQTIVAYHGSRLSPEEIASVRAIGLRALEPATRKGQLAQMLSRHPDWAQASAGLDAAICDFGDGQFGRRQGQAHLTVSRGALLTAFNHYLVEGSEFDQAVAVELLGKGARALLQEGRSPVLFTVEVPGDRALNVAQSRLRDGEMPGLVRHVLQFWANWLHDPALDPGTQHVDFGLIFYEDIAPGWITDAALIDEVRLLETYHR
ncbi:hypothetical protein [Stakelama saccharophila]|uniref:Uncharacterized protein n=1 Tax=Stakelama saccharophila TaxID=3075605 RepID=A0ABZ0BAM2_9SPHN|nr:hypothetical protein [Stakelama sp. W311]WNO54115.1 hypothetical protein RPR59_02310 [Stakelama sp. W311]